MRANVYRVHGMMQSYFTRKMTGYLDYKGIPWVSRACVEGAADLVFANETRIAVRATEFLRDARATLLARYVESRSARLDDVLDRAGILPYFADHVALAGSVPDVREPPRPALNRPFPPAGQ